MTEDIFQAANEAARQNNLRFLEDLIPNGDIRGNDYVVCNPMRNDSRAGSFRIDVDTGKSIDFADADNKDYHAGDFVGLYQRVKDISPKEAAQEILANYGTTQLSPTQRKAVAKEFGFEAIIPAPCEPTSFPAIKGRAPSSVYVYSTADGDIAYYVMRYDLPDGTKSFSPYTYGKNGNGVAGWHMKLPPPHQRLLYHLNIICGEMTVYVVEGEKTADALMRFNKPATTSSNGNLAPQKSDWSALAGKDVILWRDNDAAGEEWLHKVIEALGQHPASIRVFQYSDDMGLPEKWDAGDFTGSPAELEALIEAGIPAPVTIDGMIANMDVPMAEIASAIAAIPCDLERDAAMGRMAKGRQLTKSAVKAAVNALVPKPEPKPLRYGDIGNLHAESMSRHYYISDDGVFPTVLEAGSWICDVTKQIATRKIWPARLGEDVHTGEPWIDLHWKDHRGREQSQWFSAADLKNRDRLLEIGSAPITAQNAGAISAYIDTASQFIHGEPERVYSRIGWSGDEWLWPDDKAVYVGPDVGSTGSLDKWIAGLERIADLGPDGYLGLACVGMSVASAMVGSVAYDRLPVIGLTWGSSSGKGTLLGFAMSVWGEVRPRKYELGSTRKGIEDSSIQWSCLPIMADDLHIMHPDDAMGLMYFLGGGTQRIVSSKSMDPRGGGRRMGTSFYAAERSITQGMEGGAQKRVWEINSRPLPHNLSLSYEIQNATTDGAGALGPVISDYLKDRNTSDERKAILTATKRFREQYPAELSSGDDGQCIGLLHWGLTTLAAVTGVNIDVDDIVIWMINTLASIRSESENAAESAVCDVVNKLLGMDWGGDQTTVLKLNGEYHAWREFEMTKSGLKMVGFEFNTQSDIVCRLFGYSKLGRNHYREWESMGLIEPGKRGNTHQRKPEGQPKTTVRLSEKGLRLALE